MTKTDMTNTVLRDACEGVDLTDAREGSDANALPLPAAYPIRICPVCHAGAFAEATTCYSCMHEFSEGEGIVFDSLACGQGGADPAYETPASEATSDMAAISLELGDAEKKPASAGFDEFAVSDAALFKEFCVELHSLLGKFIVNRVVDI